jgi:hypothetical protein
MGYPLVPVQEDASDSGVHALLYVEKLVEDPEGVYERLLQNDGAEWFSLAEVPTKRDSLPAVFERFHTEFLHLKE